MTDPIELVVPIILPVPVLAGGYTDVAAAVTTSANPAAPLAVDVAVLPGDQTTPEGVTVPLATVIAPHQVSARFLPAGSTRAEAGATLGPFSRDAWLLSALPDRSVLRRLLPDGVPVPAYWVLEGIDRDSVAAPGTGVLDSWLAGTPGVTPQVEASVENASSDQGPVDPQENWRELMLTGSWAEFVDPETVLGLASTPADRPPGQGVVLTLRTYDGGGTELPAAGLLEAFASIDPGLWADHPVIAAAADLAVDLPVRFYLRFDTWDVDAQSFNDRKGAERVLQPQTVELVDLGSGATIAGGTWTWLDPGGLLEIARPAVRDRSFYVRATFAPGDRIRLERGQDRFIPGVATDALVWDARNWTARDGLTQGSQLLFEGIQLGSVEAPAAFWVYTLVRLALQYHELVPPPYGRQVTVSAQKRRMVPGHQVLLVATGGQVRDRFVTDADGEVSGVACLLEPGESLSVHLPRKLVVDGVTHRVVDRPGATPALFPLSTFRSEDAAAPVSFSAFTSGALSAQAAPLELTIDADAKDVGKGNTADAAAFHALKYARFAHDAVVVLADSDTSMPTEHEFQFSMSKKEDDVPSTRVTVDGANAFTMTDFTSYSWFAAHYVVHEYGHAIERWLGDSVVNASRRDSADKAIGAHHQRYLDERRQTSPWHTYNLVTNTGFAYSECLPEFLELICSVGAKPQSGPAAAPAGRELWEQYLYSVFVPRPLAKTNPTKVSLSTVSARQVENAVAYSLYDYLTTKTGFVGLALVYFDDEAGSWSPRQLWEDWTTSASAEEAERVHRMFRWLWRDAIVTVAGQDPKKWHGLWPLAPDGVPYPTIHDYLQAIQDGTPSHESFEALLNGTLVRWNLEPYDANEPSPPHLEPDW
jgi:hypothetical protein